ncbi:MAG: hypothetical protein Q9209_002162 [Squamulea sp. 1 TL-2023]
MSDSPAGSVTRPTRAFNTLPQGITQDEFQRRLKDACDYSVASIARTKSYNSVKVLLLYWTEDDLKVANETECLRDAFEKGYGYSCEIAQIPARGPHDPQLWLNQKLMNFMNNADHNDLLIFYYAGHARAGVYGTEGPCLLRSGKWPIGLPDGNTYMMSVELDFSIAKKATLDASSADVLYLLDCCYATTAGIAPGKELIAACSIDRTTLAPGYRSFTASIVQELNHAYSGHTPYHLTVSQIWFKLLEKVWKGHLKYTPVHVERQVGSQPRSSILLAPLGASDLPNESQYLLTGANVAPLGAKRHDVRVLLSVRLVNSGPDTIRNMEDWLRAYRPPRIADIGVSFEYYARTTSGILFFIIPASVYYCLTNCPSIQFIDYVQLEPLLKEQPSTRLPLLESNKKDLKDNLRI